MISFFVCAGFGGLATYNPNFALPVSLPLVLPQLANGLRSPMGAVFPLQCWPYPSPPLSPNHAFSSSILPCLNASYIPSVNGLSFVHLKNLPYQATAKEIASFLQGSVSNLISNEVLPMNQYCPYGWWSNRGIREIVRKKRSFHLISPKSSHKYI